MPRLLVHVEGQTEEEFVNNLLRDHLAARGYDNISARLVGNARQRANRGGVRAWSAVKKDIVRHLSEDQGCIATTMIDFYGMPPSGDKAWPGREAAAAQDIRLKANTVEDALLADVADEMGGGFNPERFVPFVVLHEFEGLLFSDCAAFARGIGRPSLETLFQEIRDAFPTPEEINDSSETAPSKRVTRLMPGYEKPLYGNMAALEVGLHTIRQECPHFQDWLSRLEALAT